MKGDAVLDVLAERGGDLCAHLPGGDRVVPWARVPVSVDDVTRVLLEKRVFYPARFPDRHHLGETLLNQGVKEVLHRNEDPLVLVDIESGEKPHAVAIFFAPREPKPKRGT